MCELTPDDPFDSAALAARFGPPGSLPDALALAVSGGSDSMALLHLTVRNRAGSDARLVVLTVDHGLRPGSAAEAEQVGVWCARLGVEHRILRWTHDGSGNLAAAARRGRYSAMAEFCRTLGFSTLMTGHTMDDQAETVLMRFARGSGVDGLAGMARSTRIWGIDVLRPLLRTDTREGLRAMLRRLGQDWIEDPTNDDPAYDRVKARSLLAKLAPLGLDTAALSRLSERMALAKSVLEERAADLTARAVSLSPLGYAEICVGTLEAAGEETACRVLSGLVTAVSGDGGFRIPLATAQRLRRFALARKTGGGETVGGCSIRPAGERLLILREPCRCAERTQARPGTHLWDGRFAINVPRHPGAADIEIGALGEAGLRQIPKDCPDFSAAWASAPREARLTVPALWDGDTLLAAPLAPWARRGTDPGLSVRCIWPASGPHDRDAVDRAGSDLI